MNGKYFKIDFASKKLYAHFPLAIWKAERWHFEFNEFWEYIVPDAYGDTKLDDYTIIFDAEIFDTQMSKYTLDILTNIDEYEQMKVVWLYDANDEDMLEADEEFADLIDGLIWEFRVK